MARDLTSPEAVALAATLKACPFCGARCGIQADFYGAWVHVFCAGCGVRQPERKTEDLVGAIEAWNRRQP